MGHNIIVQKFGGTSVSTEENRLACIKHIEEELCLGHKLVVVVSAMGRNGDSYATDTLLSLIGNPDNVSKKEIDSLISTGEIISATAFSSLLNTQGFSAISITGGEAGILTDDSFTEAKILSVSGSRILELFKTYDIVVVAGFQGKTVNGEITTLGRGGSDTSATALGVAVKAKRVDIFTDVEGVYTADPRIVSSAHAIDNVGYDEICNLAHLGAKVIHPRAVQIARSCNLPVRVRSTFSDSEGTLIANSFDNELSEKILVGITSTSNISQVRVNNSGISDYPYTIFEMMKDNGISVDLINVTPESTYFTIPKDQTSLAKEVLSHSVYEKDFSIRDGFSKVSLVGANMAGVPGVMSRILNTLKPHDIKVYQSSDSHATIWLLVEEQYTNLAISSLHNEFFTNALVEKK